jgi:hypothetical protein
MSRQQNIGKNGEIRIINKSFGNAANVFGKISNKSKFHSLRNSVQIEFRECLLLFTSEMFSFLLRSKNIHMECTYLSFYVRLCMGVKHGITHLGKNVDLRLCENRVLTKIFGPQREDIRGWRKLHNFGTEP